MRCLVCEEDLEPITMQEQWPHAAVTATIRGNYGSTVYDPPVAARKIRHLRVFICDLCLSVKASNGLVSLVQVTPREPDYFVTPWRSDDDLIRFRADNGGDPR